MGNLSQVTCLVSAGAGFEPGQSGFIAFLVRILTEKQVNTKNKILAMAIGAMKVRRQKRGSGQAEQEGPVGSMTPLTRLSPECRLPSTHATQLHCSELLFVPALQPGALLGSAVSPLSRNCIPCHQFWSSCPILSIATAFALVSVTAITGSEHPLQACVCGSLRLVISKVFGDCCWEPLGVCTRRL